MVDAVRGSREGEDGASDFAGLFGHKQTLAVYSYMFGPQRERPCPMCTNLLGAWEGNAADIGQRVSLVVVARSPIKRLIAWKRERGWKNLRLYSDLNGAYSRDYFGVLPDGSEIPAFNVFTRRDGTIRHFWSGEMTGSTADPRQDPRGAPGRALDGAGLHSGRPRRELVSEIGLRRLSPAPTWFLFIRDARRLIALPKDRIAPPDLAMLRRIVSARKDEQARLRS